MRNLTRIHQWTTADCNYGVLTRISGSRFDRTGLCFRGTPRSGIVSVHGKDWWWQDSRTSRRTLLVILASTSLQSRLAIRPTIPNAIEVMATRLMGVSQPGGAKRERCTQ